MVTETERQQGGALTVFLLRLWQQLMTPIAARERAVATTPGPRAQPHRALGSLHSRLHRRTLGRLPPRLVRRVPPPRLPLRVLTLANEQLLYDGRYGHGSGLHGWMGPRSSASFRRSRSGGDKGTRCRIHTVRRGIGRHSNRAATYLQPQHMINTYHNTIFISSPTLPLPCRA